MQARIIHDIRNDGKDEVMTPHLAGVFIAHESLANDENGSPGVAQETYQSASFNHQPKEQL